MNLHKYLFYIRWLLSCLIFLQVGCGQKEVKVATWIPDRHDTLQEIKVLEKADTAILAAMQIIQTGDIVTRTGNDFTSQSLKNLNQRDKTYSHIGIASVEHDSVFIYHALGGEWNPDEKIRRDYFPVFAEAVNNNGFGIYRLDVSKTEAEQLVGKAREFYGEGRTFDMKFDLATDDKLYCAEFVYKSIGQALPKKFTIPLSHINQFTFIGVDDIILLPGTKCLRKIKFRNS